MEGPPLGPGGEDITWPDQVALRGRKTSSTRKVKPQTSDLTGLPAWCVVLRLQLLGHLSPVRRCARSVCFVERVVS